MNPVFPRLAWILVASSVLTARGQVPPVVQYSGTVALNGVPFDGTGLFKFALLDPTGPRTYWSNDGTSLGGAEPLNRLELPVVQGHYVVLLGDTQPPNTVPLPPGVFLNPNVHLRVWFSDGRTPFQPILPDEPVASAPYALVAATVPDGAITGDKLAAGAVTAARIAPGAIGAAQLAPNAAALNLQASGGLVLSDLAQATNLTAAGFQKIGTVMTDSDQWLTLGNFTPDGRYGHVAVWTGKEMIVWGGYGAGSARLNTGARYNPSTDTWAAIGTNKAPMNVTAPLAVWTGAEMLVFGLGAGGGGAYSPATDTWRRLSAQGFPSTWDGKSAIWAGGAVLVWGGNELGCVYRPGTDTWTAIPLSTDAPIRTRHTAIWTGTEMIVWGGRGIGELPTYGGRYNPTTGAWTRTSLTNAPVWRLGHSAVWTGKEMIVWGGVNGTGNPGGAAYDPAADTWRTISTNNAPSSRQNHLALWTGTDMLVLGGVKSATGVQSTNLDAGRYNPGTGVWTPIQPGVPMDCPAGWTAVWTGTEAILWGGGASEATQPAAGPSNTGARYSPGPGTWQLTASSPGGRLGHSAVWTGTEMLVWGGSLSGSVTPSAATLLNSGARLNPRTGMWKPMSRLDAPTARRYHRAVWTGAEMIVWGGEGPYLSTPPTSLLSTGGRYNPLTDTWKAMDTNGVPSARTNFTMVWTGNEVLVFGGKGTPANRDPYGVYNTGARYFPSLDAWMATSTFRAPEPRQGHSAVWTGTEMIVWGGYGLVRSNALGYLGSGARYNPALNLWSPMATNGAPSARWYHLAAWTGSEMPVWGGSPSGAVAGAKYDPLRDSWVSMTNRDAPQSRFGVPSVWTGQELLVWGNLGPSPDGYRYDPGADSWTRMTRTGLTYGRTGHSAVWTPFGMLVFGGTENNPQALPATTLQYTLSRPMYLYRRPSTAPPAPSVSALDRPSETAGSAAVR